MEGIEFMVSQCFMKLHYTKGLSQMALIYSSFHLDKPQISVGAVRELPELPLRYGLSIRKWLLQVKKFFRSRTSNSPSKNIQEIASELLVITSNDDGDVRIVALVSTTDRRGDIIMPAPDGAIVLSAERHSLVSHDESNPIQAFRLRSVDGHVPPVKSRSSEGR
jgi:hypothetical protein